MSPATLRIARAGPGITPGPGDRRRELMRLEVPLGLLGAGLVGLAFAFAASGIPAWIPQAPMTRIGLASPLTGMTRSFVALASGRVGESFTWHPLGPVLFAACLAAAAVAVISWTTARRIAVLRFLGRPSLWFLATAAVAGAWVRQIVMIGASP